MSDSSKVSDLLIALSRIPGLSFLRQYTRHIRTIDSVKKSVKAFSKEDEKKADVPDETKTERP